jgi:hypothetical protein
MLSFRSTRIFFTALVLLGTLHGCGNSSSVANTGIAECDAYLNKVYQCLNSVSSDMGKQMLDSMKASEAALKQAAAASPTEVAASCKMQMQQAKSVYAQLGCKQFD